MERTDAEARKAANARLVANFRRAAEAESAEARAAEWRNASPARHTEVLIQVCRVAGIINRSRPHPYVKPPLSYPRVPGPPSRWYRPRTEDEGLNNDAGQPGRTTHG